MRPRVFMAVTLTAMLVLVVGSLGRPATVRANDPYDWTQTGNSIVAGRFLGTPNSQALDIRGNRQRAFRLEPTRGTPTVIRGYSGNSATAGVVGAAVGGGGTSGDANLVTDAYG